MRKEVTSAIIVFAAIGAAVAGAGIYFNSLQPGENVAFQPAVIDDGNGVVKIDKSGFTRAPDLEGISGYINTEPITMMDFDGKVVLVDFWTYTCINCIRTVPYLNAWHEKYSDDGLVILGVHAPEFDFEKEYDNVKAAIEKFEIGYPVVQDNEMTVWKAYRNNYWPHKYLVDHEGYIRYDHIGEGAYAETEEVIQQLLKERAAVLGTEGSVEAETVAPEGAVYVDFREIQTPELYLGYAYGAEIGNAEFLVPGTTTSFSVPEELEQDKVHLQGDWKSNRDNMELVSGAGKVVLDYGARAVNIVAAGDSTLTVKLDNELIQNADAGADVKDAAVNVSEERLYNLVLSPEYDRHIIEIDVEGKGFKLYTFTFG